MARSGDSDIDHGDRVRLREAPQITGTVRALGNYWATVSWDIDVLEIERLERMQDEREGGDDATG